MGVTPPRLYRYRLPLAAPLPIPGGVLHEREGLLLGMPDAPAFRWGDACPLPGWSRETIDDVVEAALAEDWQRHPSLAFAHRCAADAAQTEPLSVPINALVQGSPEQMLAEADEVKALGFRSVKVKVGRCPDVMADVDHLQRIAERLSAGQLLRLDANRAWTLAAAVRFGEAVRTRHLAIDYIEEPVADPRDLEAWHQATGLPYALDETFRESPSLDAFPGATALILKPTLMSLDSLDAALRSGRRLVFSSCFESGVGILHLARLAASHAKGIAAGLDTVRWLAGDLLTPGLRIEGGLLHVGPATRVRLEGCREVRR